MYPSVGLNKIRNPKKFLQYHVPYIEGMMKKSIAELKFPPAEKQTNECSLNETADDFGATQYMDYEEIAEPEENWMNKNDHATSQSVLTLQKSKPRRSKFSILNAQNITICQSVPNLSNGFTGAGLQTKNTCAFDCIFSAFACLYSDYSKVQAFIDQQQSSSFCGFIKKVMTQKKVSRQTYINRNEILYSLAGHSGKMKKLTSLDCETGLGGIFTKLCKENEGLASSIMFRTCDSCESTFRLVRPFLPVVTTNIDLTKLQRYVIDPTAQQESCPDCKRICSVDHRFSLVLTLEVEPISATATRKYKVGDLTQQIEVNKKKWNLAGVVEGTGGHFVCHMQRRNKEWQTYDDLAPHVAHLDTSKKFKVFMMFYLCSGNSSFTFLLNHNF